MYAALSLRACFYLRRRRLAIDVSACYYPSSGLMLLGLLYMCLYMYIYTTIYVCEWPHAAGTTIYVSSYVYYIYSMCPHMWDYYICVLISVSSYKCTNVGEVSCFDLRRLGVCVHVAAGETPPPVSPPSPPPPRPPATPTRDHRDGEKLQRILQCVCVLYQ